MINVLFASQSCTYRFIITLLALVLTLPGYAQSQAFEDKTGPLDCTIEPRTIALIGSPDEGVIEEVSVRRGDIVKQGQTLAVLDAVMEKLAVDLARLQAKQDIGIRSGKVRFDFQKLERERAEVLFKKNILSDKALDEARVQENIARLELEEESNRREVAGLELALAQARLKRRTILSPIDGIVTEISKQPGEYIHEQAQLLTLAQIGELNVEVFVPVSRYGEIELQQTAIVEPVEPIGGRYEAVVEVVDRVFDAASGTFGVRLRLDNPDSVLPAGIRCVVTFKPSVSAAEISLNE